MIPLHSGSAYRHIIDTEQVLTHPRHKPGVMAPPWEGGRERGSERERKIRGERGREGERTGKR